MGLQIFLWVYLAGCNLSSILFIIYTSELGARLADSGRGVQLPSGERICYLMFADDIFLVGQNEEDLEELKGILEGWCLNFHMKISAKKTQVIAEGDYDWTITDTESDNLIQLLQVSEYRYLGIDQKLSFSQTSSAKGQSMVAKAKKYRGAIARLRRTVPDQVAVYRALWESVAVAGIMYGTEPLTISNEVIMELDDIQRWVAKVLLGVNTSTASCVAELELGFKPFHLRLLTAKINFYLKVKSGKSRCELTRSCLSMLESLESSQFLQNLRDLLLPVGLSVGDINEDTVARVDKFHTDRVMLEVLSKPTMMLMPLPVKWWTLNRHVEEGYWSKVLSRFRSMNVGLGNRNAFYKDKAVFVENGRVVSCPVCLNGPNDEFHLVMSCRKMEVHRTSIRLRGMSTIRSEIDRLREECDPESDYDCLRLFLGQELEVSRLDLMYRGWALSELVDRFFLEWTLKLGTPVQRRPERPQVDSFSLVMNALLFLLICRFNNAF